jgi:uncharacterized protein YkwD
MFRRLLPFFCLSVLFVIPILALSQETPVLSKAEILGIKRQMVEIINKERRAAGLRPVELDDFASQVADKHCQEMLQQDYLCHWNRAGLKPYHRYSDAGGDDAVMENISSLWSGVHFNQDYIFGTVENLHSRMFNERPPNDYHRQNILQPQHTHVGIGIAYSAVGLRYGEEFVARYVELEQIPRTAKPGGKVKIKGKLLYENTDLANIYIFYEPFPKQLSVEELAGRMVPYSFPEDKVILRPLLTGGYQYSDNSFGSIEFDKHSGNFFCTYEIPSNRKGIYTIVVLLNEQKRKFPATNISIRVN